MMGSHRFTYYNMVIFTEEKHQLCREETDSVNVGWIKSSSTLGTDGNLRQADPLKWHHMAMEEVSVASRGMQLVCTNKQEVSPCCYHMIKSNVSSHKLCPQHSSLVNYLLVYETALEAMLIENASSLHEIAEELFQTGDFEVKSLSVH